MNPQTSEQQKFRVFAAQAMFKTLINHEPTGSPVGSCMVVSEFLDDLSFEHNNTTQFKCVRAKLGGPDAREHSRRSRLNRGGLLPKTEKNENSFFDPFSFFKLFFIFSIHFHFSGKLFFIFSIQFHFCIWVKLVFHFFDKKTFFFHFARWLKNKLLLFFSILTVSGEISFLRTAGKVERPPVYRLPLLWVIVCEPQRPGLVGSPGFHTMPNVHFGGRPGLQKHHRNLTRRRPEEAQRVKFWTGEGKKKREIWVPHPSGRQPSRPHSSWPSPFSAFASLCCCFCWCWCCLLLLLLLCCYLCCSFLLLFVQLFLLLVRLLLLFVLFLCLFVLFFDAFVDFATVVAAAFAAVSAVCAAFAAVCAAFAAS